MLAISKQEKKFQTQTEFNYRTKRSIETFEEATAKGKYDYWLTQEDIADIARIEYNFFRSADSIPDMYTFEVSGSIEQLTTQIERLQASTQLTGNRLTTIINLSGQHWVTLVISRRYSTYDGFYIDSQGSLLPNEYLKLLRRFNIVIEDFSQNFFQQIDDYNCGLWALENAADLNKMLAESRPISWLVNQIKRPRNLYYFNTKRQFLVDKLRLDNTRHERLISNSLQPKIELDNRIPRLIDQEQPTPKRVKIQRVEDENSIQLQTKENIDSRLEQFVESFLSHFHQKLAACQLIARGEKLSTSALKQELKTGATGALFGIAVSSSLTGTIPSLVASLRTVSYKYYLPKKKAQKITRLFSNVNTVNLSTILASAATEIFKCYEAQFMHVTDKAGDKIAMQKLAEDAVSRFINYVSKKPDISYLTVEFITKGIILGTSDKYLDTKLNKFRLSVSGNTIKDEYGNTIYTSDLYENVGLTISTAGVARFFKKAKLTEKAQYGYRDTLSWEKTNTDTLVDEYTAHYKQITPSQELTGLKHDLQNYQYALHSVAAQLKAHNIVTKITNRLQTGSTEKIERKKSILFNLRAPVNSFVGREAALNEIHQTLQAGKTTSIVNAMTSMSLDSQPWLTYGPQVSVSGLGGIGKTQLALRYAQLHAADYDNNVIWINSETKAALFQSFVKLADKLTIKIQDKYGDYKELETIIEEIYEYFYDRKSLFIFDNVEKYEVIEKYLPKLRLDTKPHVLITSRYRNWQTTASVIFLNVFTEQECFKLVKQGLSISDHAQDNHISQLNDLLHGLPLALQQAIAYVKVQRDGDSTFSIQHYIDIFKTKSRELLGFEFRAYSNDPYLKTAYTTWEVTLDQIKEAGIAGKIAIEILNIMSFICPDNIYLGLFIVTYQPAILNIAMHLLKSYSLVSSGTIPLEFVVHRLVQKVVNLRLQNDAKQFRESAIKTEAACMYYAKNIDTRFHYLYFLFNVLDHPELERYLKYKSSFKRISSIIMIEDVKTWTFFFDMAYNRFTKLRYIEFLTESFFNYRKQAAPFYILTMLEYIEKKLSEGVLTKEDIKNIIEPEAPLNDRHEYRIQLSSAPQKRDLQLAIDSSIQMFKEELIENSPSCSGGRKRRSAAMDCLQEKQALKEKKQQKKLKHLARVTHIAQFVSTRLFTKDTIAALIRGDFRDVAVNFGLLLSGRLLGGISNALLTQGEKLSAAESGLLQKELTLENKVVLDVFLHKEVILAGKRKLLGKTLKMASPFVARGTSIFFAYNLKQDIEKYISGDSSVVSSIVSNGAFVTIDAAEAGIEAAEALEIITGVSAFTGPIGEAITVLIWLGSEGYETYKGLDTIEKSLDLTASDKFIQGTRLFFGLGPSSYIELKAKNKQLIQHALPFLKAHTEVKRYIFSAAFTEEDSQASTEVHLDNKFNLTLSHSMPDVPNSSQLFCVSGTQTRYSFLHLSSEEEKEDVYFCKKAIGLEYSVNRTGEVTLIALDKGDSKAIVVSESPTIFLINDGNKEYQGSDKGNLFVILGDQVTGRLTGGKGIDLIALNNFYANTSDPAIIDREGFLCGKQVTPYELIPQCGLQSKLALKNINQISGRPNKKDILYLTKNMTLADGKGGENEAASDIIYVTNESAEGLKIVLRANTQVNYIDANLAPYPIDYIIASNQQGKAQVNFPFSDNIQLRFFFDYPLEDLIDVVVNRQHIQFTLSLAHVNLKNETFSLTLQDAAHLRHSTLSNATVFPENMYLFFKNGIQIKLLDEHHVYAKAESVRKLDEIIDSFITSANQLKKTFSIHLDRNQTVTIGQEQNEIFMTNCLAESYLIGNGGENVYTLLPLNTTLFPLPEVILYDVSENDIEDDLRDTLDLREVVNKVNRLCPVPLAITVHQESDDLILELSSSSYPLNRECIAIDTRWLVATVRLKRALLTEWYQKLDIFLQDNKPQTITYSKAKGWYLTATALTIDSDKEIIVITTQDISQNYELAIFKKAGNFSFLNRNGTDLIITNTEDEAIPTDEFYTILCSQFYQLTKMRENILSLTLLFLDQEVVLKNYEEQINTTRPFSSILNTSLSDSLTPPFAVDIANDTNTMRSKREVDFEFKKPVTNSATNFFPAFYGFFSWIQEKRSAFASHISNYIVGLNKKLLHRFFTEDEKEIAYFEPGSSCVKASKLSVQTKKSKETHYKSQMTLFTEVTHQKKLNKKTCSKWNTFYNENPLFTEKLDGQVTKNTATYPKYHANYKQMLFPAIDSSHHDNIFRPEKVLPQITANVDVNATLLLADYILRVMRKI
jgi:hypothetical protein